METRCHSAKQMVRCYGTALFLYHQHQQIEEALRQLNEQLESKVAMRTADLEQSRLEAERADRANRNSSPP